MHFAGFKVGTTPQLHMTYLMWKHGVGFRIGTSRTYTTLAHSRSPVHRFGLNGEHADAAWIIGDPRLGGRGPRDEMLLSLRYQLPTLPFVARRYRGCEGRSLVADQRLLDRIFGEIDTEAGGRSLLEDGGSQLRTSSLQRSYDHAVVSAFAGA